MKRTLNFKWFVMYEGSGLNHGGARGNVPQVLSNVDFTIRPTS